MSKVLPPVLGPEHKTGYARAFIYHFGGEVITLEFHGMTAMGKIPVPGNIVMFAFMAVYHFIILYFNIESTKWLIY